MYVTTVDYASPDYDETVQLRTELLRIPLNLEFTTEQLSEEWKDIHLVCLDNQDNLLGALILSEKDSTSIKMRQVVVEKTNQKSGIGRILVAESERIAKKMGYELMVLNAREVVLDFYLKLGYKKIGKRFVEVGIPHFKMQKAL